MSVWLASPPVVFTIVFFAIWLVSHFLKKLAFTSNKPAKKGSGESYACGESNYDDMAQPDYSAFFPFAFFFTLAHVATLIITTVPVESIGAFIIAGIYIIGAAAGLYILFRR
ncbi:MAG: hypothetical protein V1650_03200 [Candidatus Omnitrophota bacterium]